MPLSKLHQAARDYAEAGWPVFPIVANAKNPYTEHGYKEATTDLDQIDLWWGIYFPDANIGWCPENNGMCVVDEDTLKGGKWPYDQPTVKSPHGRHFYYQGSLKTTKGTEDRYLGHAIDTRGRGGYVLLPPSIVDGTEYEWQVVAVTLSPLDAPVIYPWVADKVNVETMARHRSEAIIEVELDRPEAIKDFQRYLKRNPIPPEGEGSDDATYRAICRGGDLGLSDRSICACIRAIVDFDEDWINEKIANVENYRQNDPACDAEFPIDRLSRANGLAPNQSASETRESSIGEWVPHDPRDPATMPELTFFDSNNMIPENPDGAIGILYGVRGDHKTNTILSVLDTSRASRILYAAGEGSYGLERDRISARPGLSGRIKLLPRVPMFARPEEITAFIDGCNSLGWRPEIVIIDTLATAVAGEDENTSITAAHLSDNGAVGAIKRAWNCTVIIIAHAGKDAARGVRGSSGFEGNVDFIIYCTANKTKRTIELLCKKMRDGADGHSTYWTYEDGGVPVPTEIREHEYKGLMAKDAENKPKQSPQLTVMHVLRRYDINDFGCGLTTPELANMLAEHDAGPRPGETGDDGVAEWDDKREDWRKCLNNLKAKSLKDCNATRHEKGGTIPVLKWFCPFQNEDRLEF